MNLQNPPFRITTPSYLFSRKKLCNNYIKYKKLYTKCKIYYAMKANGETGVIGALSKYVDGVEASNYDEFIIAKNNGLSPEKIICSAPVKSSDDIRLMYEQGCNYFVFDSESEYQKLQRCAPRSLKIMRIDISDIDSSSIDFGMDYDNVSNYDIQGITVHMPNRTQNLIVNVFKRLQLTIKQYMSSNLLEKDRIFYVNLGGGFSLNDSTEECDFINKQIDCIDVMFPAIKIMWLMEPGNGIVQSSGYFLCRVENIDKKNNVSKVYIDGGIPEGIQIKHGDFCNLSRTESSNRRNIYAFYDTTCLHQRLFIYANKTVIKEGDILIFDNCGAYTTCYINRFHSKKAPNIAVVDDVEV